MGKKKQEPIGYMVFWWSEDDCFGLAQTLKVEDLTPKHGILMPANKGESVTLFETREDAKEAIKEHHHFMELHYDESDDSKRMAIVPVCMAPPNAYFEA